MIHPLIFFLLSFSRFPQVIILSFIDFLCVGKALIGLGVNVKMNPHTNQGTEYCDTILLLNCARVARWINEFLPKIQFSHKFPLFQIPHSIS
jgi:hypothetical protein